jgi:hypothetical protein
MDMTSLKRADLVDAMGRMHRHGCHILDLVSPTPRRTLFARPWRSPICRVAPRTSTQRIAPSRTSSKRRSVASWPARWSCSPRTATPTPRSAAARSCWRTSSVGSRPASFCMRLQARSRPSTSTESDDGVDQGPRERSGAIGAVQESGRPRTRARVAVPCPCRTEAALRRHPEALPRGLEEA